MRTNLIEGRAYKAANPKYKSFDIRLVNIQDGEVELLSNIRRADGSGTMYIKGDFIYLPLGEWELTEK